jgi:uncharacterized protein (TIGR02588 family)
MASTRRKKDEVPAIEWIAGGVGFLVVLATLALLGYEVYRGERDAPDLRITLEGTVPRNDGHSVRAVVRNVGRGAAAAVIVEGVARALRSEAHLDYVAGLSEQAVTLVFPEAPDRQSLSVRIVGFTTP